MIDSSPTKAFTTASGAPEDFAPALLWLADDEHQRFFFNRYWLEFTGRAVEQEQGNGWLEAMHREDVRPYLVACVKTFAQRENFAHEYRLRRHDGEYRWIYDTGAPRFTPEGEFIGYAGAGLDITERKEREDAHHLDEEKLRQSPKLEAIGRLAGGVAHDFNTLTAVILLHADLLLDQLGADHPQSRRVHEIKLATDRAAKLTQQLLAFSRNQVLQPRLLNLNVVVSEIHELVRRLIGEDIKIHTRLDPALGLIMADPDQMAQVIMNLAVNARDAMPDGGSLSIQTAMETVTVREAHHEAFTPGNYVKLIITDTGTGIGPEHQAQIFDPFYTTKGTGRGTGLGLSTVYGIVKQSNGYIWLSSEPGQGTSFSVYLPLASRARLATEQSPEGPPNKVFVGDETILIVEDEKMVRDVAREVLADLGYTTLEAVDGYVALDFVRNYEKRIDLMLADVIMPNMNGKELGDRLQNERPDLKVLFMSGYIDESIERLGLFENSPNFIRKPFSPLKLAQKVRETLDEEPALGETPKG